jgi:hypothetical protein
MISFCGSKNTVARFVADLLLRSKLSSASITITTRGSSEDCYVHIAIDTSLEETVKKRALIYFSPPTPTSPENTQGG